MIALIVILVAILATITAVFAAWRTWRAGYLVGYTAGRLDGIDLLAHEIANDIPD